VKTSFNEDPYSGEDDNPLVMAVHELDKSQKIFFDAATDWIKTPSAKKLENFNNSIEANGNAFYDVVTELATAEDIEPEEKSMQIATLFITTDKDRVEHFRSIAPQGKFARLPQTRQTISETILKKFEFQDNMETICFEIVSNYANHLSADTKRLLESIESSNKIKLMKYADQAKDNASQIGKLSLGVAIGSILASRVIKKLDNN